MAPLVIMAVPTPARLPEPLPCPPVHLCRSPLVPVVPGPRWPVVIVCQLICLPRWSGSRIHGRAAGCGTDLSRFWGSRSARCSPGHVRSPRSRSGRGYCVHRWGARAGCADASSSLWAASAEVKLRWVSVPAGGDHGGCAVVLALWALVPWRRRVAGRTGIEVDHVTIYRWVHRFTPLLIDAARPCRHAPGDRWFVDET